MSFNKIILVGNLGRDPELRYTPQGTAVCSFSLATNDKRRSPTGEMQDQTTWFRVTLWDKKAEIASKFLTKGKPVYIEGRLRLEEYTDKDGKQRQTLEVTATEMQFIGSREDGAGAASRDYSSGMDDEPAAPRQDYRQASSGGGGGARGGNAAAGASGGRSSSGGAAASSSRIEYDDFESGGGANDEDIPF